MRIYLPVFFFLVGVTSQNGAAQQRTSYPDYLLESEKNTINVIEAVAPSVVHISNMQYTRVGFFSFDVSEVPAGTGTGFVWDELGHVVTNYHVVQGSDHLLVSFKDGKTVAAALIGVEPRKDIAVLKVKVEPGMNLKGIPLSNSSSLIVGQKAIAIGSPFGLDQSVTAGIISAMGRSIPGIGGVTIRDMIQTDASINPGNSGGPLLDSRGSLIAMNTMIFSQSGGSAGIGFGVPSNTIKRTVEQIVKYGKVRQAGLGIVSFDASVARRLGLDGVVIKDVFEGGGAAKAGIRPTVRNRTGEIILGDVILAIDNRVVKNFDDLYNLLEDKVIGSKVSVTVLRQGKRISVPVELIDVNEN